MRATDNKDGFSLHAISGTRAVQLHMNARQAAAGDLLGFGVGLRSDADGEITWLNGFKCFASLEPNPVRGQRFKTVEHPVQDFKWGHYAAEPDREYRYVVRPLFRPASGDLANLRAGSDLEATIRTESEEIGDHSLFFNRGAIVSQAYAERFDDENLSEEELAAELDDPSAERTKWLSRGLLEGALAFIAQARSSRFSLHCGFYELTYPPILRALSDAAGRGATVEVTFEADHFKRSTNERVETKYGKMNRAAIAPLQDQERLHFRERIHFNKITHNKFIVLKEDGRPVQVWTGSTNITASGFCGQSNTGHVVRDEAVAQAYSDYFNLLARDEQREEMKRFTSEEHPDPDEELPPNSVTPLFSPRQGEAMLDWYGRRIEAAQQTVILTSAFGVTTQLAHYFDNDRDYLRYVLMEQRSRGEGAQEMVERDRDTRVVFGQGLGYTGSLGNWRKIPGFKLEHWMWREHHFRTSGHVFFVHTKYMGIDVLTDDPLIFTGSANFSPDSLTGNDENMLLIRGNQAVSDTYLTDFFRLLNHFYFRQVANQQAEDGESDPNIRFLEENDAWVAGHYRAENYRSKRRELFGVPA